MGSRMLCQENREEMRRGTLTEYARNLEAFYTFPGHGIDPIELPLKVAWLLQVA